MCSVAHIFVLLSVHATSTSFLFPFFRLPDLLCLDLSTFSTGLAKIHLPISSRAKPMTLQSSRCVSQPCSTTSKRADTVRAARYSHSRARRSLPSPLLFICICPMVRWSRSIPNLIFSADGRAFLGSNRYCGCMSAI